MMAWGDKVFVSHHLSEKLSTSGDIGRCKGVLMNEFPLLAGVCPGFPVTSGGITRTTGRTMRSVSSSCPTSRLKNLRIASRGSAAG